MKAPVKRGQNVQGRWSYPDAEWLQHHYVELGKTVKGLVNETGADRATVERWLAAAGVGRAPSGEGLDPPRRHGKGPGTKWTAPGREWLAHQHHVLGKSVNALADEVGASRDTALVWLQDARVEVRPAYEGSSKSRETQLDCFRRSDVPFECSWCGVGEGWMPGVKGRLQMHHRDHDPTNGKLTNLTWMCYVCNLLEAWLRTALEYGKIDLKCEGHTMVISFK